MQVIWQDNIDPDDMTYEVSTIFSSFIAWMLVVLWAFCHMLLCILISALFFHEVFLTEFPCLGATRARWGSWNSKSWSFRRTHIFASYFKVQTRLALEKEIRTWEVTMFSYHFSLCIFLTIRCWECQFIFFCYFQKEFISSFANLSSIGNFKKDEAIVVLSYRVCANVFKPIDT